MLSRGGQKAYDIERMRYSWMLSRVLIYWCVPRVFGRIDHSNTFRPHNQQVNANGNVVRSEILGAVKMKCYLSGMPELRLGLNDKVMFDTTGRSPFLFLICDSSHLNIFH